MLSEKAAAMLEVLDISFVSILMIFVVMMLLYAVIKLLPVLFREKRNTAQEAAPAAEPPALEEDGELLAVITAAVQAYEQGPENTSVSLARDIRR